MFVSCQDKSVGYTGRWSLLNACMTATAPGSYFDIAFKGKYCTLHFNTEYSEQPYGHIWICYNGNKTECAIDNFLRFECENEGVNFIRIIYKSAVEMHHRWHIPLVGKLSFIGYDAEGTGELIPDRRKTIEFIGDSITEGVLVDEYSFYKHWQHNRVYQDDVTATYAWLLAQRLDLRPYFGGYGAVGLTHGGCGCVPKAIEMYDYCFDGHEVSYPSPDYILINHGANDRNSSPEEYLREYSQLLDKLSCRHPMAKIIVLSAFVGAFADELNKFIICYNKSNNKDVIFIDGSNIVPVEPLHPLRDGHRLIADTVYKRLKDIIK